MSLRTHAGAEWFFEGVPADELAPLIAQLEVRSYAAGTVVMAEGDRTREIYIPQSGSAEVLVSDSDGSEHRVGRVVPGGTVGEISLLTGQPAVAHRARDHGPRGDRPHRGRLRRLASTFPQIYRNVGIILAERLARTNRLVVGRKESHLIAARRTGTRLRFSAYALACSIAWHTQRAHAAPGASTTSAGRARGSRDDIEQPPWRSGRATGELGADLIVSPSDRALLAAESLSSTFEALFGLFQHVLVHAPRETIERLSTARPGSAPGLHAAPSRRRRVGRSRPGWTTADTTSRPRPGTGFVRVPAARP